jgi:hypothetical protein
VNNRSRSVIATIVARLSLATDLNSGPAMLNIASLVHVSKQYTGLALHIGKPLLRSLVTSKL